MPACLSYLRSIYEVHAYPAARVPRQKTHVCMSLRHQTVALARRRPAPPPQVKLTSQEAPKIIIIIILSVCGVQKRLRVLKKCINPWNQLLVLTTQIWPTGVPRYRSFETQKDLYDHIAFPSAFPIHGLLSPRYMMLIIDLYSDIYFQIDWCPKKHVFGLLYTYLKLLQWCDHWY